MLADDDNARPTPLEEADALLSGTRTWSPPSIDDVCNWGKHKGRTYRDLARLDPSYAKWAATTIGGTKGQLCAEALAAHLGVTE